MSNINVSVPEPVINETPLSVPEQKKASVAYEAVLAEIDAVPQDSVLRVNLDISRAASRVLGALAGINALRPEMAARLTDFDFAPLDKLETYAYAAWYAHILAMPPSSSSSPVQPLLVEAAPLRDKLLVAAEHLAYFGFFEEKGVAEIRRGSGYIDIANDLVGLHAMFKAKWSAVADNTPITAKEMERAMDLGSELLKKLGARLQPNGEPVITGEAVARRARAFTLFMSAYDTVRRAVGFVRWNEGDAELIAPSVFMRTPRRKAGTPVEPEPETVLAPAAPTPAVPTPPSPDQPPA